MTPSSILPTLRLRAGAFLFTAFACAFLAACASGSGGGAPVPATPLQPAVAAEPMAAPAAPEMPPSPMAPGHDRTATGDAREGLAPGMFDAGEAIWNLRLVSATPPEEPFVGSTNSDLAFTGNYAIQGNYDGIQVWDLSDPARPASVVTYVCPASQSDVSVYENLLFVSGEGLSGRLDCGVGNVREAVSHHRLRGIRIFDISNIAEPEYVANVQTCRGSHTHTVLKHPGDDDNVYIYVSGSAPVRPAEELAGCSEAMPFEDPNSALFRIEVIRVPLANPAEAAIVSSPRIFEDLVAPPRHGSSAADMREVEEARERGALVVEFGGETAVVPDRYVADALDDIVAQRGGEGAPTAADSAALRQRFEAMAAMQAASSDEAADVPAPGPTQCHDITVYPAIGLAGGACEGYGLLLDIADPANPQRLAAVADSNFSYWHSATFNNDGTAILFTDEWGGGGGPKCRAGDPMEWGANAIFTIEDGEMDFQSYYKLPAVQTSQENCVAHNGSLIPVPGRDIMIQAWYQGGLSMLDWTDPANPVEIGYFDRGPVSGEEMLSGGSWSVYWYNGFLVSSEIARGLDVLALKPSAFLTQNEIDAANSVRLDQLNSQGQPIFEWPATFALARAYLDQLERSEGLAPERTARLRRALNEAEAESGSERASALRTLADRLAAAGAASSDPDKLAKLADAIRRLADE